MSLRYLATFIINHLYPFFFFLYYFCLLDSKWTLPNHRTGFKSTFQNNCELRLTAQVEKKHDKVVWNSCLGKMLLRTSTCYLLHCYPQTCAVLRRSMSCVVINLGFLSCWKKYFLTNFKFRKQIDKYKLKLVFLKPTVKVCRTCRCVPILNSSKKAVLSTETSHWFPINWYLFSYQKVSNGNC